MGRRLRQPDASYVFPASSIDVLLRAYAPGLLKKRARGSYRWWVTASIMLSWSDCAMGGT